MVVDVAVEVGAGQHDDQRPLRKARGEGVDRGGAAPRVQRDHQVRVAPVPLDLRADAVAVLAQETRIACGRVPIAVAMVPAVGRDENDAHARSVRRSG
jgi:hypothetical protein